MTIESKATRKSIKNHAPVLHIPAPEHSFPLSPSTSLSPLLPTTSRLPELEDLALAWHRAYVRHLHSAIRSDVFGPLRACSKLFPKALFVANDIIEVPIFVLESAPLEQQLKQFNMSFPDNQRY